MTTQPAQLDRKDLKILALKEELSRVQDLNADFRTEITLLNDQIRLLNERLAADESVAETGEDSTDDEN